MRSIFESILAAVMVILITLDQPSNVIANVFDHGALTSIECRVFYDDFVCRDLHNCPKLADPFTGWGCFDSDTDTRYSLEGEYSVFAATVESLKPSSVVSFDSVLASPATMIYGTQYATITIRPQSSIRVIPQAGDHITRKLASTMGTNTALLVRLIDKNGLKSSWDASKTSNEVFGTGGDTITLKSVIEGCSNNQLMLQPYASTPTNNVVDGVLDLQLNVSFSDFDAVYPANAAAGEKDYRNLVDFVYAVLKEKQQGFPNYSRWWELTNQHIFIFINDEHRLNAPVGYSYAGWASIGGVYSIYNGESSLQTLAHELGHNLALGHSGDNGYSYGDE
jgi:hypothetical protein